MNASLQVLTTDQFKVDYIGDCTTYDTYTPKGRGKIPIEGQNSLRGEPVKKDLGSALHILTTYGCAQSLTSSYCNCHHAGWFVVGAEAF